LINLAKSVKESAERGEDLGLNSDEMAFYDALCAHGDAKNVMGEKKLAAISLDLVKQIRKSVTIDWTRKESVRAHMRVKIKRLLRKHGYPPDKNEEATETVIEQAEVVYQNWDFDTNGSV
jgi:type I restriction enzyme, R subunit